MNHDRRAGCHDDCWITSQPRLREIRVFANEKRYPTLPWKQIRGMRNRMAHGYFDINLDVVWDTIQHSLPELEREIVGLQQAIRNEANI